MIDSSFSPTSTGDVEVLRRFILAEANQPAGQLGLRLSDKTLWLHTHQKKGELEPIDPPTGLDFVSYGVRDQFTKQLDRLIRASFNPNGLIGYPGQPEDPPERVY